MGRKLLLGATAAASVIISRTLVYTVLTAVIGAVYFGLIAVGRLAADGLGSDEGLVAALAAGALFHPVRRRLQLLVDRLFKVERDPYKLVDAVSQTVQTAGGPAEALASGAAAIRQALRVPGVRVEVDGADAVTDGALDGEPVMTPLVWHGRTVGRLLVSGSPRRAAAGLPDMLARHLAEVAHAVQLTEELRQSREKLLAAREQERARLLRVLGDGLGSTLATLATEVGTARALVLDPATAPSRAGGELERVDGVLVRVREELAGAVTDVRDLVYGLHPPAPGDREPRLESRPSRPAQPAPEPEQPADEEPGRPWVRRLVVGIAWAGGVLSPLAVFVATWMAWKTNWAGGLQPLDPLGTLFPAGGAFVITFRRGLLVPWLMWSVGVTWSFYELVYTLAHLMYQEMPGNPLLPYLNWASIFGWIYPFMTFSGIMPLLFPDGRLPSRRWRFVLYGLLAVIVVHTVEMALMPNSQKETELPLANPFGVEALGGFPWWMEQNLGWVYLPLCLAAIASVGIRYWKGDRVTRRQIAWYVATMVGYAVVWVLRQPLDFGTAAVFVHLMVTAGVPISVVAAVLRHRFYGIRVILDRALVYGALATVLTILYAVLIWAGDRLAGDLGPAAGLVAALSVGGLFHPVRLRLQRSVDQLLGVERDPYRAADKLSRSVQQADEPSEALATATSLLRWAVGARGAGVEVDGELYADGRLGRTPEVVTLAWHGEPVGRLLLSRSRLAGARREPLAVMAKHLAELAHAVHLAADLRRSRERIAAAREEERRRLGRELHDGLGPALTSVTMTLDAARRSLPGDPARAADLLTLVHDGMGATLVSVRELVDGLRPPALDNLGLAGSLVEFAKAPGPRVEVQVSERLGELPAAVELAAYRIVQEALTNVRRHAAADSARVHLSRTADALHISIHDDGAGLPAAPRTGVGLTSMRERATEVGGWCDIASRARGGTKVTARLPL
ncbi:histidine kinase [Nonomuraea sp. NPDC050536]|uniref:histidine kinase n=1 Tax=Nonomuraea sp. NPDC050536 TaxID=3364366 RepID=UPI0037CB0213